MEIRPILSALMRGKTAPLLVAVQVAISLAILANALFVVQQRIAAAERPSGIAVENDLGYLRVSPLEQRSHTEILAQQQRELAAMRAVPGVKSVSWVSQMPMSTSGSSSSVRADKRQVRESATPGIYYMHPGTIGTLGLNLIEGRDFTDDDMVEFDPENERWGDKLPRIGIISKELGKLMYPDASNYLGRVFYFGAGGDKEGTEVRIIGVVERLQTTAAQHGAAGEYSVILPWRISSNYSRYAVRFEPGQREKVMPAVEAALRKANPALARIQARSVVEDRARRYRNEKAMAWMLITVSALLLLVTVSGIVGMTTLRVAQRRKQIGVRRALGARWRDIVRYFVTENLLITTGGIAAGLLLALALNQLLDRLVGIGRLPGEYMVFGALALWLLGLVSVWGPASRAANTPPAIATRTA